MSERGDYAREALHSAAVCLQWQASDATDDGNGYPISERGDEYTPKVMCLIRSNVNTFVWNNWETLKAAEAFNGYDASQCGHDIVLTANGHGAGFWDRGIGELGNRLTNAVRGYSFDAEFALDSDGDVDYLMVENKIIVNTHEWAEGEW